MKEKSINSTDIVNLVRGVKAITFNAEVLCDYIFYELRSKTSCYKEISRANTVVRVKCKKQFTKL